MEFEAQARLVRRRLCSRGLALLASVALVSAATSCANDEPLDTVEAAQWGQISPSWFRGSISLCCLDHAVPAMMVYAPPGRGTATQRWREFYFADSTPIIGPSGLRADSSILALGRIVRIAHSGSGPLYFWADTIVVEPY